MSSKATTVSVGVLAVACVAWLASVRQVAHAPEFVERQDVSSQPEAVSATPPSVATPHSPHPTVEEMESLLRAARSMLLY